MQKIYNIIVFQKNEKPHEKATPDDTFQAVKYDQDLIDYLIILNRLCFSNKDRAAPHPFIVIG